MTDVLMYALKSAFVLFLLYVPYTLLLHRDSFFRLNRFVLLGVLLLSLVLPLCNVSWLSMDRQPVVHAAQMQMVEIGIPVNVLPQNDVVDEMAEASAPSSFTLFGLLTLIYIIGMGHKPRPPPQKPQNRPRREPGRGGFCTFILFRCRRPAWRRWLRACCFR